MTTIPFRPAVRALGALRHTSSKTWYWFGIYVVSALIVLMLAIWLALLILPSLREFALSYIFPQSWHPFVNGLIDRLLSEQMVSILTTAGMTLGVVVVGICLFPVKEKLSSSFEADAFPDLKKSRELSLIQQGFDELKLLGIYAVLLSVGIFFGLQGNPTLSFIGTFIGNWYFALAMALDHSAPVFQRRGIRVLGIIYLLFRHVPLSLHLIGAIFVLPAVLLPYWLAGAINPVAAVTLVVLTEVVGMAFATLAGCALGAELIEKGIHEKKPPRAWTWGIMLVMTLIIIWQGIFFTSWGVAAHQHSQLLKCQYDIDWKRSDFDIKGAPSGDDRAVVIELSAPVSVTNQTGHDLVIRNAQLDVRHSGVTIGSVGLPSFSAPSGKTTEIMADLSIEMPLGNVIERVTDMIVTRNILESLSVYLILDPPLSPPLRIPIRRGS